MGSRKPVEHIELSRMNPTPSVVVLGASGMLGHVVFSHLHSTGKFRVQGSLRKDFDAEAFPLGESSEYLDGFDAIVNCIGIIKPYCKDDDPEGVRRAIRVNALFPHQLGSWARANGAKVIQIATDCVYSGARGKYVESDAHDALDVYGKTKSLGEVLDGSVLNIRCSIVGPELKGKLSLLEWFLAQPEGGELNGFSHHLWNGVTTLQFGQLCEKILEKPAVYDGLLKISRVHHFIPNETVSKLKLLELFSEVFGKKFKIRNVDNIGPRVDRSLDTKLPHLKQLYGRSTLREALMELRRYVKPA